MYDSKIRRRQHAICVWIVCMNLHIDIKSAIKICNFLPQPPYKFCNSFIKIYPLSIHKGYIIFTLTERQVWNRMNRMEWQENKNIKIKRLQLLDYYSD